jgi:hypothetical protein
MPAARTASSSAVVPLLVAIPSAQPTYVANSVSNSRSASPNEPETSPRRSAATTSEISASRMSGSKTGIRA